MNKIVDIIMQNYLEGKAAEIITGRSLFDLELNKGQIQPIREILRSDVEENFNLLLITYNLASGISFSESKLSEKDKSTVYKTLREFGIVASNKEEINFSGIIKGIIQLALSNDHKDLKWRDDKPLRFLFLFEFFSHLVPAGLQPGTQTQDQLISSELAYIAANSIALRKSGNFIIFNDICEGLIDTSLSNVLPAISLKYPDFDEKLEFIKGLKERYPKSTYKEGLNSNIVGNLNSNTSNKGLENLFLASEKTGNPISSAKLVEQKTKDIAGISEGTLTLLNTERVKGIELKGINIQVPMKFLFQCAEGLRNNNFDIPSNLLFIGGVSSGKSDLALLCALMANVPAYSMNSPKAGVVGSTERRAKIQMDSLRNLYPNIGFIDEVTEAYPMQRSEMNLDSGASSAVTASLLEALSDKTRAGKSLIIATSNCGWRIGTAMLSRFMVIPVLMPVISDYPQIVLSIAKSISPDINIKSDDNEILEASGIFFEKNISPRIIRAALCNAKGIKGKLDLSTILFAANDVMPQDYRDRISSIYSDYSAIRLCSSRSLLPWNDNPKIYPFPDYIRKVLNDNMNIDIIKLNDEMERLKPLINV